MLSGWFSKGSSTTLTRWPQVKAEAKRWCGHKVLHEKREISLVLCDVTCEVCAICWTQLLQLLYLLLPLDETYIIALNCPNYTKGKLISQK